MPALALGMDPELPDIMKKKPRDREEGILDRKTVYNVAAMGLNMGILLLVVFFFNLSLGIESARTALFMGFVLYEFMRIAVIRHGEQLAFFQNRMLITALVASMLLQLLVVYSPLNSYFSLVPLGLFEWGVLITFGIIGWFTSIGITRIISHTGQIKERPNKD